MRHLRTARYDDEAERVEFGEIRIFVAPAFVITVRRGDLVGAVGDPGSCGGRSHRVLAPLLADLPAAIIAPQHLAPERASQLPALLLTLTTAPLIGPSGPDQ